MRRYRLLLLRRDPGGSGLGTLRRPPAAHRAMPDLPRRVVGAAAVAGDLPVLVPGVPGLSGDRRRRRPVDQAAPHDRQGIRRVLGAGRLSRGCRTRPGPADQDPSGVLQYAVSEYLEWFEDAYFLFTVRIFDASAARRNTNPKKVYCIDHALIASVSSGILVNSGHLLENLVFTALRRRHAEIQYYRTRSGREVDFVVPRRGRRGSGSRLAAVSSRWCRPGGSCSRPIPPANGSEPPRP